MRPERKVLSPGKALLACAAVLLPALSATTAAALPLHRRAASLTTGRTTLVGKQAREGHKSQPAPAPALRVTSVTPADGATGVGPEGPVTVTFSAPLAPSSPMPSVSPEGAGTWTRNAPNKLTFRPSLPFVPLSRLTLTVPGGKAGVEGSDGSHLARTIKASFQVRDGTVLRLQQVLSLLDYSPLAWVPRGKAVPGTGTAAQLEAFYKPPAGTFRWRQAGWPTQLTSLWKPGVFNVMTAGLVMEFQADHLLIPNGHTTAGLWADLLHALAAHEVNTGGYDFALANKARPESFTVWKDGKVVLKSPANTGVGTAATPDGVFPVFARYRRQVMRGTDPLTGAHYADPVQYVAYFHHQDAVHYIYRAYYGIPQSLGCVELPLAQAAKAWPYLAYGTLVAVVG